MSNKRLVGTCIVREVELVGETKTKSVTEVKSLDFLICKPRRFLKNATLNRSQG